MSNKNWDMIRLFESINKTKIKGSLITESTITEQPNLPQDYERDQQAMDKINSTDIDQNKPPENQVKPKRRTFHKTENYHNTQAEALEDAEKMAQSRGYEIDYPPNNWAEHVGYGQTQQYTLDLKRDGVPVNNRKLIIVLYRMPSGKYELTAYVA